MGFHVFLDLETLEAGDFIPAELQHSIASAALHIAIFSPNYAQSPWCLAELSFMLKTGAKIIPIFYHVDPLISDGLSKEEENMPMRFQSMKRRADTDKKSLICGKGHSAIVHSYTATRSTITSMHYFLNFFNRQVLHFTHWDEASLLKNIVNSSFQIMKKVPLWVVERPVGLDELVQGFESSVREEKVKITGIVGMGGSGKTTLAKELYNMNFPSFERCSFVFDVRDAASRNFLCEKQKKLLADLDIHHFPFDNVDEGKVVLANHLRARRVLIVLDDVDHIDHLNALLPNKDNLGSKSMVIVTTWELGVLKSWGLSHSCIYNMPTLEKPHAEQLFCLHAFRQPSPPAEF
ncbi:hypothetical protein SUGI_0292320 [Cryptomeria japonica]|nr:hypothetical protein SUGI_0292320 [Cryptomeria japonica]